MIDGFQKGWEVGASATGEIVGFLAPMAMAFALIVAAVFVVMKRFGL